MNFKNSYHPLYTTEQDINLLFEMVRNSSYVSTNLDYDRKGKETSIMFSKEDNMVNAWARSYSEHEHEITMLNGICNSIKMTAIALAHFKEYGEEGGGIGRLALCMRWLGHKIVETNYKFPISVLQEGINEMEYDADDAIISMESKSYAAGGILSVIAHELGHICLSHTLAGCVNNETSRNDERQADLFGCSVSATTPFASHIVLATLFVEIVFNWMHGSTQIATTHPASSERIYNTINAHDGVLKALGITKENIEWFLPKDYEEPEEEPIDDSEPGEPEESEDF